MPASPYRFDVAFAYAAPHRDKVRAIAEIVAEAIHLDYKHQRSDRVFFDEWFKFDLQGGDADARMQRIYLEQSLVVVADVSEEYSGHSWSHAEFAAIRDLKSEIDASLDLTDRLRLLPIRFQGGQVSRLWRYDPYLDGVKQTAAQCAAFILRRRDLLLERLEEPALGLETRPHRPAWWRTPAPRAMKTIISYLLKELPDIFDQALAQFGQVSGNKGKSSVVDYLMHEAIVTLESEYVPADIVAQAPSSQRRIAAQSAHALIADAVDLQIKHGYHGELDVQRVSEAIEAKFCTFWPFCRPPTRH